MSNYHLIETESGWGVGGTCDDEHVEDADGVTVAPGDFVELHPDFDGSPESVRKAIREWEAEVLSDRFCRAGGC